MNRHKEEHMVIEESLHEALYALMKNKPFTSITITELINKAGVSRATYYRNYNSKEQILREGIRRVLKDFRMEFPIHKYEDRFTVNHYNHIFKYATRYRDKLIILRNSGFSSIYLEELNRFLLDNYATSHSEKEYFELMIFAGAEFNLFFNYVIDHPHMSYHKFAQLFALPLKFF
ncbi:MAG: TetR/AcrR family transcriptional regulator [Clostridiaceae bacterium]